jgi:hypothetical protein
MRSDLNKLLCERERHRSGDHFTNYRQLKAFDTSLDEDDGPNTPMKESMKRRYNAGWSQKELNENLNPLWGAVRKAVGRPWDKFYSELCENFDKRSVINQHILQHLFDKVETKDIFVGEDGKLWDKGSYGGACILEESHCEYYVDPRDGILKFNKQKLTNSQRTKIREAKFAAAEAKVKRVIDKENVLHLQNGVWFHYTLKDVPVAIVTYRSSSIKNDPEQIFNVQINYGKEKVNKMWKEMNGQEQKTYGHASFRTENGTTPYVRDLFTNELIINVPTVGNHRYGPKQAINTKQYHATKKTASKQMLKLAGLA